MNFSWTKKVAQLMLVLVLALIGQGFVILCAGAAADALLDAEYDFEGEHKRWLTFGVPRAWDLLSALRVLAAHGYGRDPRFRPLLDRGLARQDAQGRWLCGPASRTWPLEKRNQPSKWVTLDAVRLLKRVNE